MKVKIDDSVEHVCPEYLTVGKVYEAFDENESGEFFRLKDNDGEEDCCCLRECPHLEGGNWIEVK